MRCLLIPCLLVVATLSYRNFEEMLSSLYFLAAIVFRLPPKWTFGLVMLLLLVLIGASSLGFGGVAVRLGNYVFVFLSISVFVGLMEHG